MKRARWAVGVVLALLGMGGGLGAQAAGAAASTPLLRQACDAAALQSLPPPAQPPLWPDSGAAAYFLDASRLQWPGQPAAGPGERHVLAYSAAGGLSAAVGQVLRGADGVLQLLPDAQPLPAALAQRFAFLGAGPRWRVAAADRARLPARLPALWRGQLMLLRLDAQQRVLALTAVQLAGALDDHYGAAALKQPRLGSWPGAGGRTEFALWAPTARAVHLCLYPSAQAAVAQVLPLRRQPRSGVWQAQLAGGGAASGVNASTPYYSYLVEVWQPRLGWVRNRVNDPYALSLSADSRRSWAGRLDDPRATPPGWAQDRAPDTVRHATDMVMYELHVRDFSVADTSVSPAHRGKYLAFTEAHSQGMQHLQALARAGLTDVHLLPVFDFGSVPEQGCIATPVLPPSTAATPESDRLLEATQAALAPLRERDCFNWGYDPVHFNAPEGSYASDPDDGAVRLRELRQMVMALHRAGLRVGMDVVFNHMFAAGQHDKSVLDRIVPGYYHRLNAQGEVETSTCCANTATEHLMMARLMSDSLRLWAGEHHIDSFRFDLMGHQPRAVMEAAQQRLRRELGREVVFIGEGWNFGEVADGRRFVQASQLSLAGSGIATFSDRGRDALRGGGAGDSGAALVQRLGWLAGATPNDSSARQAELLRQADWLRVMLAGSLRDYRLHTAQGDTRPLSALDYAGQSAGYTSQPGEVVNYAENHDNPTLFDTLVMKLPAESAAERARLQTLGAALVAFSQGLAYFHAGQDLLRSKSLDRNSFNSGDVFNRIDWSGQSHNLGVGLPPEADNRADWPQMAARLADAALRPQPADIHWARAALRDLLTIRRSSALFRLHRAEAVQRSLSLLNTGPGQLPALLAGHLRAPDELPAAEAGFAELVYAVNAQPHAQTLAVPALAGRAFVLHPVHTAAEAADSRPAQQAQYLATTGQFTVPARTAVVWVVPHPAGRN